MGLRITNPCFTPAALLLAALSLSIGWGIRGNYGHEFGAMLPGALAAIVVALVSGREDWRQRVVYFAFFGALGWGFGGSMSYGQVLGYTHSGDLASQSYGFAALFVIGFLWAALGGAGTALPAVFDRRRLTEMFRPLSVLLSVWAVLYFALPWIHSSVERIGGAMRRHESLLYWLDSDWLQVLVILVALLIYDLVDRRCGEWRRLVVYAAAGGLLGFVIELALRLTELAPVVEIALVRYYGDLSVYSPEELVTNWPNFLFHMSGYIGCAVGLAAGVSAYFWRFGEFRDGSSLFVHMAVGWFVGFLVLPVLLDVRMTPPRGDNWAGVLGVFGGASIYFVRQRLHAIVYTSTICGIIGGIGFSCMTWLQIMMISLGNPARVPRPDAAADPAASAEWEAWVASWRHWQSANWHSFLEQTYGFVNGLAVIVALGLLARRLGPRDEEGPRRRWTQVVSVVFVVPVLLYVNQVKNLGEWTREYAAGFRPLPESMKAPLFESLELSAQGWFDLLYWAAAAAFICLLIRHLRRPLALVPPTPLGRGQLLFSLILWSFVLGNFAKQLVAFREGRLITEGVILLNAVIATLLILSWREATVAVEAQPPPVDYRRGIRRAALAGIIVFAVSTAVETWSVRWVYPGGRIGMRGPDLRFGPEANAKVKPLLKGSAHR